VTCFGKENQLRRLMVLFYFKSWVTYKPSGNHYWETYYKGPLNV
jgi:hypothetical protein